MIKIIAASLCIIAGLFVVSLGVTAVFSINEFGSQSLFADFEVEMIFVVIAAGAMSLACGIAEIIDR